MFKWKKFIIVTLIWCTDKEKVLRRGRLEGEKMPRLMSFKGGGADDRKQSKVRCPQHFFSTSSSEWHQETQSESWKSERERDR